MGKTEYPERPAYFKTPSSFRAWLRTHHASKTELWVGFHKVATGSPSMTWPEAVDEALCYGWIDGVRRRVDERRYIIRFTPRRPRSRWSAVNIGRFKALTASKRMRAPGRRAFERGQRTPEAGYAYEARGDARLESAQEERFRASETAWAFFESQPPGYRHTAVSWVTSAKKPETRDRRLRKLIRASARGERVPPLARPAVVPATRIRSARS